MKEVWKPVVQFKGLYDVSNKGRVRSYHRGSIPRLLKPGLSSSGYFSVVLNKKGQRKSHLVHCLVAEAFLGLRPPKYEVMHLDGTRINNFSINLCWGTCSENNLSKRYHGTDLNGEKHPSTKLSEEAVSFIKTRSYTETQRELARCFGVSQSLISMISNGQRRIIA